MLQVETTGLSATCPVPLRPRVFRQLCNRITPNSMNYRKGGNSAALPL